MENTTQEYKRLIKELKELVKQNYRIFNFLTESQKKPMEDLAKRIDVLEKEIKQKRG